ncbi:unnamed protein product [Phaedon cochleariae]|uniref:Double jelly roll-like domain-containing protein n=1 Tax=Phaedon cochleariae TaxID=80249 RepID=A0A9N9X2X1_PHACE|nr:unnamed protein product [Phaedon cochleariae]
MSSEEYRRRLEEFCRLVRELAKDIEFYEEKEKVLRNLIMSPPLRLEELSMKVICENIKNITSFVNHSIALQLIPRSLVKEIIKIGERVNNAIPGATQTQSVAKIKIESINLKVPHLTPNDNIKLQLLPRIKADEPMLIPFRRWELHELPALTQGSTIEIWSVKTCSALESPRYVIVFFQTKKSDNIHEDVTLFDNANIKSIRLALNSDYYPQERMQLDFSKDQYADAHFNYTEFNKSYHNCSQKRSLVNFDEFKTRPMFVIDCSRRHLGLKSSTIDIKLDIEATTGFPADTKAYCIIVHDQIMEHLPLSEIVRNIA